MRRFVDEWRVLPGTWWVWSLPVVVAAGALLLAPLNARLYHDYLFGALHPVEEYRATAVQLATSGFFVGQVVALLFGAVLVLRDRSAAAPVRPAKLAMAALGGALLGGVTVTAAASVAASRLAGYWAIDTVRHEGRLSPDPLRTAATWRAVGVGLVGFPVWAVIGVGLAALLGRWVLAVPVLLLVPVAAAPWLGPVAGVVAAPLAVLYLLPLPASSNALTVHLVAADPSGLVAVVNVLFMLLYAGVSMVDGRAAWRRRRPGAGQK